MGSLFAAFEPLPGDVAEALDDADKQRSRRLEAAGRTSRFAEEKKFYLSGPLIAAAGGEDCYDHDDPCFRPPVFRLKKWRKPPAAEMSPTTICPAGHFRRCNRACLLCFGVDLGIFS